MLSKSKYCAFVQCPGNLWLKTYKPELATPDSSVESRMEAGNEIGDLAMQLFGDFVEVTAHKNDGKIDLSEMISRAYSLLSIPTIRVLIITISREYITEARQWICSRGSMICLLMNKKRQDITC